METNLKSADNNPPSTLEEILDGLRRAKLGPRHESKSWGDWIYLDGYSTVISIEVNHGLSSSATIEHGEGEEDGEPIDSILRTFAELDWRGIDPDGDYPLC